MQCSCIQACVVPIVQWTVATVIVMLVTRQRTQDAALTIRPNQRETLRVRHPPTRLSSCVFASVVQAPAKVRLQTLSDCQLAVSVYPFFSYNAEGGGGEGVVQTTDAVDVYNVSFDAQSLQIPPLDYRSTRLFGIPLPPPLKIEILPQSLAGTVNAATGDASLSFDAQFVFSVGALYQAPPLVVRTDLTSGSSSGEIHSATGEKLDAAGKCRLVGVARVPKTSDAFLNTFLMLPTDALAVLSATVSFS